ncbi:hypothetical protein LBMAG42_15980 [Deltaproteobacteria bacterium]|nr:hypothetical protein LBMAG42_15980 [Deltaproteobacteria bacterium]
MSPPDTTPAPRRRRKLRRNLLFGAIVTIVVLYLLEVGLRLAGVQPAYQADAVGGWRMLPRVTNSTMRGHEGTSFTLTTNDDGLRTTLRKARTPGVKRVALLGDSTTFGWGVNNGETLADGLQAGLDAAGERVEVMNAGQPGYSTTQMVALYDRAVHLYQPDVMIVFVPMHDNNQVLVSDREYLNGASGPLAGIRVLLAENSRIYQVLRQRVYPLSHEASLVPGRDKSAELRVPRVSDRERDNNFDHLRESLSETGGIVAIGHLPFLADLLGEANEVRFSEPWGAAYSARTGAPIVDLRACCAGQGGEALVLPLDPGHLNAAGNRLVGAAAVPPVRELLAQFSAAGSTDATAESNR